MLSRFCKTLLLLLCCWLLTGPQLLLQLGAWTWMIASYSQESTFEQAFKETFGGDRPCEMCKIITAVDQDQEENPLNVSSSSKLTLMLGLARAIQIEVPEANTSYQLCENERPLDTQMGVPTPPPRWV